MLARFARSIVLVVIASLVLVAPASGETRKIFVHNFNDYPEGVWLPGSAVSSWEVKFPEEQCGGTGGCRQWFIGGYIKPTGGLQNGLGGGDVAGPITARFTYPVTSIAVIANAGYQFNAAYTLSAFDRRGRTVGTTTVVNNQDQSLPDFSGFGYFPVKLAHLRGPACSFTFSAQWLAGSFYHTAGFMLGTITLRLQSASTAHRCDS